MTIKAGYILISDVFHEIGNLLFPGQWNKEVINNHIFEVFRYTYGGYLMGHKDAKKLCVGNSQFNEIVLERICSDFNGLPISKQSRKEALLRVHQSKFNPSNWQELSSVLKSEEFAYSDDDLKDNLVISTLPKNAIDLENFIAARTKLLTSFQSGELKAYYHRTDNEFHEVPMGYWYKEHLNFLWKESKGSMDGDPHRYFLKKEDFDEFLANLSGQRNGHTLTELMKDELILKNLNVNPSHFEAIKDSSVYRMLLLALKLEVEGKRSTPMKILPDIVSKEDWVFKNMETSKELFRDFASYVRPIEKRKGAKSKRKPTVK